MKKTLYILSFTFMAMMFVMAYYLCFYCAKRNINDNPKVARNIEKSTELKPVAVEQKDIVTKDTVFSIESCNLDTGELSTYNINLPDNFIGMDRDELVNYLNSANSVIGENSNLELIAFSSSNIVVRKTISQKEDEKFYIILENDTVKVYKEDKKTLYINTEINTSELEQEDREILENGIFINSLKELYDFLETITS